MSSIPHLVGRCDLPLSALLRKYVEEGAYTDCYTTGVFKLERLILKWLVAKPSSDSSVTLLARGQTDFFSAWSVEARAPDQILMCDFQRRTRSWLMVAPIEGGADGTRLFFGSAVVPMAASRKVEVGKRAMTVSLHSISLAASCSMLLALPAHAQDAVGYGADVTCVSAIDAEIAQGSHLIEPLGPPDPVMKDFYGTILFDRNVNGTPARIIYLCQGTKASGGSIVAQLIYVDRESEEAARSEFARQKELLEARLGAPCWDPSRLSETQRQLLPAGTNAEDILGSRTEWRISTTTFTDISWNYLESANPKKWQIVIHTHRPMDMSSVREPLRTLYRMGACERLESSSTGPP